MRGWLTSCHYSSANQPPYRQGIPVTPAPGAVRLMGHQRRFAESIAQIDTVLEFALGASVSARRDEVVAAASASYGPSEDFRGVRDAWDAVFPDGVYSAVGLA